MKLIFNLPFETHTRFVESLTSVPHLKSTLHARYIGFLERIKGSKKPQIKMLFNYSKNNNQSNTGQNITYLMNTYNVYTLEELISKKNDIKTERVYPLEKQEQWKSSIIHELSLAKLGLLETGLDKKAAEDILEEICIG